MVNKSLTQRPGRRGRGDAWLLLLVLVLGCAGVALLSYAALAPMVVPVRARQAR